MTIVQTGDYPSVYTQEQLNSAIAEYYQISKVLESGDLNTVYGASIASCIAETLEMIAGLMDNGKSAEANQTTQLQLQPLLRHFYNDLILWLEVYPYEELMTEYRSQQISVLKQLRSDIAGLLEKEYLYDVTISITAFNKLSYTRLAVESILRHTDFVKHKVELILIDNGSTDGTGEYFATISGARCIRLKRPLGYPATSLGAMAARGRYFVHFANDIIATENWLDNLLRCIKSDSNIGMVVPVCNYMSSSQSITVNYRNPVEDLSEMEVFARGYNRNKQGYWQERVRLLPCLSIMPTVVAEATPNDALFHFGEFADDDMSVRLRRAGFRQIFAADTFVHHFGSVTSGDAQHRQDSLHISRLLFKKKWGIDAWTPLDWDEPPGNEIVKKLSVDNSGVLWIDPQFCATPMRVRGLCERTGVKPERECGIVTDPRYLSDAEAVLSEVVCNYLYFCLEEYTGKRFSVIAFREDITEYLDGGLPDMLLSLSKLLVPGGVVYSSYRSAQEFKCVFTEKTPDIAQPSH